MTHDELCEWGAKRLKAKGYTLVFANMRSAGGGEQPDILGVKSMYDSIVVEVKVSRSDFLADRKKPWRKTGHGMGSRRAYLTPPGLLNPDEIPYGWQLWEAHPQRNRTILKVVKGEKKGRVPRRTGREGEYQDDWVYPNCKAGEVNHFRGKEDREALANWLIVILRRVSLLGFDTTLLSNCDILKQNGIFADE